MCREQHAVIAWQIPIRIRVPKHLLIAPRKVGMLAPALAGAMVTDSFGQPASAALVAEAVLVARS